jgi:hypothetical protein
MRKNLMVIMTVLAIVCTVWGIDLLVAKTVGTGRAIQIPPQERVYVSPSQLSSVVTGLCEIANDDGTPAAAEAAFDSGLGYAVYMDPGACALYPYPFKITDAHFFLYEPLSSDYVWPVDIQINILGVSGGDICSGPESVLCSQTYTVPHDSAYPKMINLSLSPPYCVTGPFFLEVKYLTPRGSSTLPGLVMDEGVATGPDTCINWFDSLGTYQTWMHYWGEPLETGDVILRATGYPGSFDCDSLWYWKPDTVQAPSGMPDFDQYQFPEDSMAFCGPTAVANCLWWYNAVPESLKDDPASFIRLLSGYFHTDADSGTKVDSIKTGLNQYFRLHHFNLYANVFAQPYFEEMEDSLKKCQDVILLLGFYQKSAKQYVRFGGHYVTMAGVCSESLKIAISDPARDAAESGWPGRVRPPDHPLHPGIHTLHNDTVFVCHDIYQSDTTSLTPGNPHWWIPDYGIPDTLYRFEGENFQPDQYSLQGPFIPSDSVFTEVEYAIMVCPKAGIDTCWYYKPDTTNAPSGMPDFDQYQFPEDSLAFCGPTAVANCLWWYNAVPEGYKDDPPGFIRLLSAYFHTDKDSGTYVDSIQKGLDRYFADYDIALKETTYVKPVFAEMGDSLKKCQDIILLLGFWQSKGGWYRVGGHYVTMAGVCISTPWVAISDPARDPAESGWPGEVWPEDHPVHPVGDTLHNNPLYVSHDAYLVWPSPSPGGVWQLPDYPVYQSIANFTKQNFESWQKPYFDYYDSTLPVYSEVEYAIMICPKPPSSVEEEGSVTPKYFELYQNHPNPFNSETVIRFNLEKPAEVTLVIYNSLGQKVRTLLQGRVKAGLNSVSWDGKDEKGKAVSSGVYLYELKSGALTETKRMVLLK